MNWKRLEHWVTMALYIAGATALVIMSVKRLAPERSLPQRIASDAAIYLTELGNVSGGLLIMIVLCILRGSATMASIFHVVDRYREWKKDEQRRREEFIRVREESIAEGRVEGRASAMEDIRARLIERGIDPNDILQTSENGSEPPK